MTCRAADCGETERFGRAGRAGMAQPLITDYETENKDIGMKKFFKFMRSPWTIFVAMILGMVVGLLAPGFGSDQSFIGALFIKLLRMGVVPLIFVNVIHAIIGLGDAKKFARIGGKTVLLFMVTTFFAALLGCLMAALIQPGTGFVYANGEPAKAANITGNSFSSFVLSMVPTNIITALSEGNMLQIVVFAVISGIAILYLDTKYRAFLSEGLESVSHWLMRILDGVLVTAPIGIFSLGCNTMASYGIDVIRPVAKLVGTAYAAGFVQLLFVYPLVYLLVARKNPLLLMKKLPPVWLTAFSTRSTNATLPVSLDVSKNRVGVSESVADFVIPFGASVNCDGAAFFLGICATFTAQSIGMDLSFSQMLLMALVGAAVTLGNTGIPNSMFIMVPVMLTTFGLPLDFMGLMGIYPIIDSITTTCNVTGDNVVAATIDAVEKRDAGESASATA